MDLAEFGVALAADLPDAVDWRQQPEPASVNLASMIIRRVVFLWRRQRCSVEAEHRVDGEGGPPSGEGLLVGGIGHSPLRAVEYERVAGAGQSQQKPQVWMCLSGIRPNHSQIASAGSHDRVDVVQ